MSARIPQAIADLAFLVVEDHGFQRWALGETLAGLGARRVMTAANGRAALDIIAGPGERIDVIVTDLDMPGMDGMEFIRHLGESASTAAIVVASGLDPGVLVAVADMAHAYGVRMLATIRKPVTAKNLEAALLAYADAPQPRAPVRARPFSAAELRGALDRDEFEPFFQPKLRMRDATVSGAEALARWRHPGEGLVTPGSFIDLLEAAGMGEELALVIAAKAARACREWRAEGFPGPVSINLSAGVLAAPGFADRLLNVVRAQGLEAAQMTLEITETASLGAGAIENVARSRMQGFGLSIDDFGIGHSSIARLARIAFTELKIDRAFVRDAARGGAARAMLESMLEMAASLEITAVAEGIERREEWDALLELGCGEGQGFFMAKPMDHASYLEWLRRYSPAVLAASASATNCATESVSPRRVESTPARK